MDGFGPLVDTQWLAIRHAGLGDGRLFVGSWSAWGSDPDRPVETG